MVSKDAEFDIEFKSVKNCKKALQRKLQEQKLFLFVLVIQVLKLTFSISFLTINFLLRIFLQYFYESEISIKFWIF